MARLLYSEQALCAARTEHRFSRGGGRQVRGERLPGSAARGLMVLELFQAAARAGFIFFCAP
jgi:hypothetical protein